MYLKRVLCIIILLAAQNIFPQEKNNMEIKASYFKLIEKAYDDMEARGIDLSEYEISISVEKNVMYIEFYKPWPTSIRGSPPGYPGREYEIDIASGEIMKSHDTR
jgi:hypothetical protein